MPSTSCRGGSEGQATYNSPFNFYIFYVSGIISGDVRGLWAHLWRIIGQVWETCLGHLLVVESLLKHVSECLRSFSEGALKDTTDKHKYGSVQKICNYFLDQIIDQVFITFGHRPYVWRLPGPSRSFPLGSIPLLR